MLERMFAQQQRVRAGQSNMEYQEKDFCDEQEAVLNDLTTLSEAGNSEKLSFSCKKVKDIISSLRSCENDKHTCFQRIFSSIHEILIDDL